MEGGTFPDAKLPWDTSIVDPVLSKQEEKYHDQRLYVEVFKEYGHKIIWYDDPKITHAGDRACAGMPPIGSKYRCHGTKSGTNPPERCPHWSKKGWKYCRSHLRRGNDRGIFRFVDKDLAIYSRSVGPTLKAKLEELAKLPPEARHSLREEIDLARVMAEKSLKMYDALHFGGKEVSDELKIMVATSLQRSIKFVTDVTSQAAKVKALSTSTVDLEQVDFIVQEVTRIVEEEIADYDREMADRVIERLKNVKVPTRGGSEGLSSAEMAEALRNGAKAIMDGITADAKE